MFFLRWLVGFLIVILISAFAVLNRGDVSVIISPVHADIIVPIYLVSLLSMVVGFILGSIIVWLNMGSLRKDRRRQKKEIKILEFELSKARDEKAIATASAISSNDDSILSLPHK